MLAAKPATKPIKRSVPYYIKGSWDLSGATEPVKPAVNVPKNWRKSDIDMWKRHMFALREKFPDGFKPIKRLSREKIEEVRDLKRAFPELTNDDLGMRFKVSPESIRHVLKSKWKPDAKEHKKLQARWKRRGDRLKDV